MRSLALLPLAAALAGCMATTDQGAEMTAETQSELATAVAGRTAGPAVTCVNQRDLRGNRSAGDAIVFEGTGNVLYVNRPAGGCPSLNLGRALRTRTTSTRLCSGDIATVFDPVSGIEYGGCGLGEFTPYRRVG